MIGKNHENALLKSCGNPEEKHCFQSSKCVLYSSGLNEYVSQRVIDLFDILYILAVWILFKC